jgi:hypothetical protein
MNNRQLNGIYKPLEHVAVYTMLSPVFSTSLPLLNNATKQSFAAYYGFSCYTSKASPDPAVSIPCLSYLVLTLSWAWSTGLP